jgi:hypothetical protein
MNYQIEVRNGDGDLIEVLKNLSEAELTLAINTYPTLSFSLPTTDPQLHYITKATEFWVRETDSDEIKAKTKMILQEDEH